MQLGFLHLENGGSPTSWDGGRYFRYLALTEHLFPEDLRDMVQRDRFGFDTARSFWHSELHSFSGHREQLELHYVSDDEERNLIFRYDGIKKLCCDISKLRAMPSMVIQELTVSKHRLYRHAIAHLGGEFLIVYAQKMTFLEQRRN